MTNRLISEKIVSWDFAPPFDFTAQFLASRARRLCEQTSASPHKKSRSPIWRPLFENARTHFERKDWRSAPPPLADARHPAKKFSSHFLICARRIFSSKRKRKTFWLGSALNEQGGGASLRQAGKNSFPQTPFLSPRVLVLPWMIYWTKFLWTNKTTKL